MWYSLTLVDDAEKYLSELILTKKQLCLKIFQVLDSRDAEEKEQSCFLIIL